MISERVERYIKDISNYLIELYDSETNKFYDKNAAAEAYFQRGIANYLLSWDDDAVKDMKKAMDLYGIITREAFEEDSDLHRIRRECTDKLLILYHSQTGFQDEKKAAELFYYRCVAKSALGIDADEDIRRVINMYGNFSLNSAVQNAAV